MYKVCLLYLCSLKEVPLETAGLMKRFFLLPSGLDLKPAGCLACYYSLKQARWVQSSFSAIGLQSNLTVRVVTCSVPAHCPAAPSVVV